MYSSIAQELLGEGQRVGWNCAGWIPQSGRSDPGITGSGGISGSEDFAGAEDITGAVENRSGS